jgi:hypothetical protein
MWTCPALTCRVKNRDHDESCELCGTARPDEIARERPPVAVCPFDGARLRADGWCEQGDGFPMQYPCPFVCDVCRSALTWAGTCHHCDRYAPGDRYEYDDKHPHWRLVEKGPFEILPPAQQAQMAADFAQTIARLTARMRIS